MRTKISSMVSSCFAKPNEQIHSQKEGHMLKTEFWLYLIKLGLISLGIYCLFRFLFPLFLPFLMAYLVIYLLTPIMERMETHLQLPKKVIRYSIVVLAFLGICAVVFILVWKIIEQIQLFLANAPMYQQSISKMCSEHFHAICQRMDDYFGLDCGTTTNFLLNYIQKTGTKYQSLLSEKAGKTLLSCLHSSFRFFAFTGFFVVALFILTNEFNALRKSIRHSKHYISLHFIWNRMRKSGVTYLKTECIILLLNWMFCSFSVFLLHNPYFFLIGAFIAFLDAFPVIGSGLILIPWSIVSLLQSDYFATVILLGTFLATLFIREILEAKLLGKGMGMNPFIMLLSIYVGIQLFGPSGILFGPLGSVLLQTFLSEN